MVIVTGKHLEKITEQFPDAAVEIAAWIKNVRAARWKNLAELLSMYRDADYVRGYVVFNIRHNRYRLVTVVHSLERKTRETHTGPYLHPIVSHPQGVR